MEPPPLPPTPQASPSSGTKHLCSRCSKIPFAVLEQGDPPGELAVHLGPLSEIQQSRCGFCRLVSRAIFGYLRTKPSVVASSRKITVEWVENKAPGGRSGFMIDGFPNTWLAFEADEPARTGNSSHISKHSYLRSKLDPELDIQRVASWIRHCERQHPQCSVAAGGGGTFNGLDLSPTVFRLIDVQGRCLLETQDPPPYVALSYVWGAVTTFRLTKANRARLLEEGAIEEHWASLPATIRDAIELVGKLDFRYLWVDSLCLVQNDSADVNRGVNFMDHIFEKARLTIVSANGYDANAGLPGVRIGSRDEQPLVHEVKPGTFMGVYYGHDLLLARSVYETRAWT